MSNKSEWSFQEAVLDRLSGKIALITGAARGIGEAIARSFVREGANVYLTDIETDAGEARARDLGGSGASTRATA